MITMRTLSHVIEAAKTIEAKLATRYTDGINPAEVAKRMRQVADDREKLIEITMAFSSLITAARNIEDTEIGLGRADRG